MRRLWAPAAAACALAYLALMLVTGALPENRQLAEYHAHGVLELEPESITRVTVMDHDRTRTFVRQAHDWIEQDSLNALNATLTASLERAVKFMHGANPVRVLEHEGLHTMDLGEFGLDHPHLAVALANAQGTVLQARFGSRNTDGFLQYMQVEGSGKLYLMSSFVGKEWETVLNTAPR